MGNDEDVKLHDEQEETLMSDEAEDLLGEEERAAKSIDTVPRGVMKWRHLPIVVVIVVIAFVILIISVKNNDSRGNHFDNSKIHKSMDRTITTSTPTNFVRTLPPTSTTPMTPTMTTTSIPTTIPTNKPTTTVTKVTTNTNTPTNSPTTAPSTASQQEKIDWMSPAYQNPNDQPFSPPKWIQSYIQYHNSRVIGDKAKDSTLLKGTRWIQWYCAYLDGIRHCGGLGDRLKGMFESLLFAIIDRRVSLLEEWETPTHPLLRYLEPNLIDWSAQPTPTDRVKNDTAELVGIRARPNKDIMYDVIHNHPCDFPQHGANHTGIRYTGNYFTQSRVIKNAPCIRRLWERTDNNVQSTVFWTMFRFSRRMHEEANRLRGPIETNNYYVAAHIRTGNGTGWNDSLKHSDSEDWDTFSHCIQIIQDAMERRCGGHRPLAYLASDNQEAKEYVQAQHPPSTVHAPEVEIMHIDRSQSHELDNATAAYDAVVAEFKILLDST